jgi:hypothetical protein
VIVPARGISVQRFDIRNGTSVLSVEQQRGLMELFEIVAADKAGGGHRKKETRFVVVRFLD